VIIELKVELDNIENDVIAEEKKLSSHRRLGGILSGAQLSGNDARRTWAVMERTPVVDFRKEVNPFLSSY
jgi:hypothetical protein